MGLLSPKESKLSLSVCLESKSLYVSEGLTISEFVCYLSSQLSGDGQPCMPGSQFEIVVSRCFGFLV